MARFSRERDDATRPKIWRLFALLRARQRELRRPHEQAGVVSNFSHVEPGDMEYFKTVDVPPAVDKVPPPTPWE
jgi:hypothetical protein